MISLKDYKNLLVIDGCIRTSNYVNALLAVIKENEIEFDELARNAKDYYFDYKEGEKKKLDYKNQNKQYALKKLLEFSDDNYSKKMKFVLEENDVLSVELYNQLLDIKKILLEIGRRENKYFSIELINVEKGCVIFELLLRFFNDSKDFIGIFASLITILTFFAENIKNRKKYKKYEEDIRQLKQNQEIMIKLLLHINDISSKPFSIIINNQEIQVNNEIINTILGDIKNE